MEKTKKPNIFFLLIDSFRSDKFYGNEKTSITLFENTLNVSETTLTGQLLSLKTH